MPSEFRWTILLKKKKPWENDSKKWQYPRCFQRRRKLIEDEFHSCNTFCITVSPLIRGYFVFFVEKPLWFWEFEIFPALFGELNFLLIYLLFIRWKDLFIISTGIRKLFSCSGIFANKYWANFHDNLRPTECKLWNLPVWATWFSTAKNCLNCQLRWVFNEKKKLRIRSVHL